MDDRTTNAAVAEEKPTGDEPEARADSAAPDDPESLRTRVSVAEQQRDEYLSLLQRVRADFENFQKRIQRDLAEERRHAHGPFARELLAVLDNLQRALDAARKQGDQGPLVQGVTMVQSQLGDIFKRSGITPIEAQGKPFDPHQHEAMQQQPRADVPPGEVVEVLEPGYRLHERVLRPARVVVAATPGSEQ